MIDQKRGGELRSLTGVRALAALWVLLCHYFGFIALLFPATLGARRAFQAGNLGVDLFFLLSGFIITLTYVTGLRRASVRQTFFFLGNRIARIFPLHLLMIAAFGVLALATAEHPRKPVPDVVWEPFNVLMNLVLANQVPHNTSINPVAWSLSLEFAAYLAFPVLALGLARLRRPVVSFGLAAVVLGVGLWVLDSRYSDGFTFIAYELTWLRIACEFPAGCLLAMGWIHLGRLRSGRGWDAVAVLAAAGVVASISLIPKQFVIYLPLPAIACLALLVVSLAGATGPVARLMSSRPMVWGGQISFSLYMSHFGVLLVLTVTVLRGELAALPLPVRALLLAAILALPIAVAAALHHWFEEPVRRRLRARMARYAPAPAPDPQLPQLTASAEGPTTVSYPDVGALTQR